MDDGAGATGTKQISSIAVRMNLARKRLERLVGETRKHSRQGGRSLLEGLGADMAGIPHENHGDN